MLTLALWITLILVMAASAINLYRLVKGPDIPDRLLALDTIYVNAIALIVIAGLWFSSKTYFEAAMLIALLGFVSTMGICRYLLRGNIIE